VTRAACAIAYVHAVSKVLAFFDLDHTLLSKNTGVLYALFSLRQGRISRLDTLRSLRWAFMHRLGRLDVESAYAKAGALFRGMSGAALRGEAEAWFEREVRSCVRPQARRVIAMHRGLGHEAVLLTNSSSFIAEAASTALGMDGWLANQILLDPHGRVTGHVPRPLCYGPGKVEHARRFAATRGASLKNAWFYTDSISDLPMLLEVGTPVAVHPDRRLLRAARQHGFRIADWS
jgi:HAD superfamily hydrolase (TIGR01490 family)